MELVPAWVVGPMTMANGRQRTRQRYGVGSTCVHACTMVGGCMYEPIEMTGLADIGLGCGSNYHGRLRLLY